MQNMSYQSMFRQDTVGWWNCCMTTPDNVTLFLKLFLLFISRLTCEQFCSKTRFRLPIQAALICYSLLLHDLLMYSYPVKTSPKHGKSNLYRRTIKQNPNAIEVLKHD